MKISFLIEAVAQGTRKMLKTHDAHGNKFNMLDIHFKNTRCDQKSEDMQKEVMMAVLQIQLA